MTPLKSQFQLYSNSQMPESEAREIHGGLVVAALTVVATFLILVAVLSWGVYHLLG